ncbi:MAG TPA: DUF4157 domain-containing protein [Candidatus Saccharimonadales bacterium]|nr:DUF4157 domain-containing protein [Candidatus Saccharimonadales bacterium]
MTVKDATGATRASDATSVTARPESSLPARKSASVFPLGATLGNQAMLQLLNSGEIQAKLNVSQPGDADEIEADRVADHIVKSSQSPKLQRKCSCSGGASCAKCQDEELKGIHRKAIAPVSIQRAAADRAAPEKATSDSHSQPHHLARPTYLIVEDDAAKLEHGQMKKSEFLKLLKSSVSITADAALAASQKKMKSSPFIEQWLEPYAERSSHTLEGTLLKYAPEAARAHSAREYIPIISNRVERAVFTWAKTGQISGVPEELAKQFSGGGGGSSGGFFGALQSFASSKVGGSILGFLGGGSSSSVHRKAKESSHAGTHDAASVRTQLSAGHPLDSRVQSQMSSAFGYDFSPVRVHTDSGAASLSSQLSARAFTIGKDVAFGSGEYQPGTPVGDALIAHELAHVVQQGGGQASAPLTKSHGNSSQLEEDADTAAVGAVATTWANGAQSLANLKQNAMPRLRSGLRLQRCSCGHGAASAKSPAGPAFADEAATPSGGDFCKASPITIEIRKSRDLSGTFNRKAIDSLMTQTGATLLVPMATTSVKQHEVGEATLIWSNSGRVGGTETGKFLHDWERAGDELTDDGKHKIATDGHLYGLSGLPGSEARTKAEQKGFDMETSDWELVEDLVFTTTASDGKNVIKRCRWGFRFHAIQRSGGKQGKRTRNAVVHYWGVDSETTTAPFP